jgi:hypothetical protein
LPTSCADCLKIWEPQLPEPSGPVQGCTGIALPSHGRKRGKAKWVSHIWRKNCLVKHVIERMVEGKWRPVDEEEEDVNRYWMTLRKRGGTGN